MPPSFLPDLPVLAAPMSGGPGTPELVAAAANAGSMGFLAAGYKTPAAVATEIAAVDGVRFGVNLFAPNPVPVDPAEFRSYAELLAPEADRYGIALPAAPVEDPPGDADGWHDKLDVLRAHPVPVVSFTFGIPPAADLAALRATGAVLVQTVTSAAEARAAAAAGMDALVVQSAAAGGHSGTLTPRAPAPEVPLPELVAAVRAAVDLPLVAAGGIGTAADVTAALAAGASARSPSGPPCCAAPRPARRRPTGPRWPTRPGPAARSAPARSPGDPPAGCATSSPTATPSWPRTDIRRCTT